MAEDPSQLLAQKMLEGWCMLNKECEACGVPIMRSRTGEELCVGCNATKKETPIPPPIPSHEPAAINQPAQSVLERKIHLLLQRIEATDDLMQLQSLGQVLKTYLEALKLLQEVRLS